ncbi:MFS transporter [Leucobacter sp. CSA1]|uniref:MFS transporter n=1 Tax=Leucobacter chromiisoli TaxID=2796471 RepID=A0A934Q7F0_9MICO|nr:MFS transporter [Leucobacter chromiisoli]MBK0419670.1 MFS transporter [Leucobacter chromiisoli]
MGIYRDLGRSPGVFRVLFAQLTARFPFGMLSIILLLHIQLAYGDYTSAGIILASQSVGQAIAGPLTSRMMGRWGMRPVLTITSLLCASLLVTIALVHLPLAVVAGIAFLVGISTPPVTPAVRTIYPKLVPGRQLSALFSLDASAQEIIWVFGPVVAVFVSSQFGTSAGLLVAAAFMVGGGAWFIMSPAVAQVRIPRARRSLGAVLRRPTVVISTIVGFLFVASFAAIEAGIVAAFADQGGGHGGHGSIESGIVLAVFAGGSLIGGLLVGHRQLRPWSMLLRALVVLAGTALCLVRLDMWWLALVLFLGGLGTAPVFAALSNIVSSTVKFSETAEAYGWVGTGQLVGVAAGSAVAGIAIDAAGPRGAILVSVGFLLVTVISAAVTIRWLPDLRGKDATPLPDTEPLQLPD